MFGPWFWKSTNGHGSSRCRAGRQAKRQRLEAQSKVHRWKRAEVGTGASSPLYILVCMPTRTCMFFCVV